MGCGMSQTKVASGGVNRVSEAPYQDANHRETEDIQSDIRATEDPSKPPNNANNSNPTGTPGAENDSDGQTSNTGKTPQRDETHHNNQASALESPEATTTHEPSLVEQVHDSVPSTSSATTPGSQITPPVTDTTQHASQDTASELDNQQRPLQRTEPMAESAGAGQPKHLETPDDSRTALNSTDANKDLPDPLKKDQDQTKKSQDEFDAAVRFACELIKPEEVLRSANSDVFRLQLTRALPSPISLTSVLQKLPNLQVADISGNNLGPQGFRAVMLALRLNTTLMSLNIANNQADTDSADCVGKMLKVNRKLISLDVSGNSLGKDYFSRCVGPALADNTSLKMLSCESIGSTDLIVFSENLVKNTTLEELNLSHNELNNDSTVIANLTRWMKSPGNSLLVLKMKNCGLKGNSLIELAEGVQESPGLCELNVAGNQLNAQSSLLRFLVTISLSLGLMKVIADDLKVAKVDTLEPTGSASGAKQTASALQVLSVSNCGLKDDHVTALEKRLPRGHLAQLQELNVTNNSELTAKGLRAFHSLLMDDKAGLCVLEKISWGLNKAEGISGVLSEKLFPNLKYLNLRKASISPASVGELGEAVKAVGIEAFVLDGIKLSGSNALSQLFQGSSVVALSLSGCQVTDKDLEPLALAAKQGSPFRMLKLSVNRLTDSFVGSLVESLLSHESHPLALIDLSNNKIGTSGAKRFCDLFTSSRHRSTIHSLNLSSNVIPRDGLKSLMAVIGESKLTMLQASHQQSHYDEDDMEAIFEQVANTLKLTTVTETDTPQSCSSSLPEIPTGFSLRLTGLGGYPGALGQLLDSSAIATDHLKSRLPYLSLQHALEFASYLKGCSSSDCLLSSDDWNHITSVDKDAPSWLKVDQHRQTAVYLSHLPSGITVQKMEGLLEMEADCNVKEVYLTKDLLSGKNNGYAWVLLCDRDSVDKALAFYLRGEAKVLGKAFLISKLNVQVDDEANSQGAEQARRDLEHRLSDQTRDLAAHRTLIRQSYQESQDRHAYRLAHPAYADGRIW